MTDIEAKALALVREVLTERNLSDKRAVRREVSPYTEALCRAIEQHETYKQEVSDALVDYFGEHLVAEDGGDTLASFVIHKPKPDPLVEVLLDMELSHDQEQGQHDARYLRAKLEARGLEIREKGQ